MTLRIGALLTHPIQYYSPWFRHVAQRTELSVYYAHRQTKAGQANAGFGVPFEWNVPLLEGYPWTWLRNVSARPGLDHFGGCDTPEITEIVHRERFDAFIMFGWNKACFLQAGWAAQRSGTPLLIRLDSQLQSPRSAIKRLLKAPVYSAVLPHVGHYLSPGRRSDAYLRRYAVPAARIHRLNHLVDSARFRLEADHSRSNGRAAAMRAEHGASPSDFVFLMTAKLIPKKRPMLALDALLRLRETEPALFKRAQLWFAGDGPLRTELESRLRGEDIPARLLGFINQNELPTVYAAADCLLLPSDANETWGLVVNEAFACGTPAIVSNEAGCAPDLIEPGITGWRLEHPTSDALCQLLGTAMRNANAISREALAAHAEAASFEAGAERLGEIVRGLPRRAKTSRMSESHSYG